MRSLSLAKLFGLGLLAAIMTALMAHAAIEGPKPGLTAPDKRKPIVVFAAASLKTALDKAAELWRESSQLDVVVSYAGSGLLARQISQGAPAEVFISANRGWMDALAKADRIDPRSRLDLMTNRLVLIGHAGEGPSARTDVATELSRLAGDRRIAMGLVDSVPAGIYGKAALQSLNVWEALSGRVAQSDNVRAALAYVARGEAQLGIVYASDAKASKDVSVIAEFPQSLHEPIVYPAAVVAGSRRAEAAGGFLTFLTSAKAQAIFQAHGFAPIQASFTN